MIDYDSRENARNMRMEKSSTAIGELCPLRVSPNVMQWRPKRWPGVRAQIRLQRACAIRIIEKTGDSSAPLRMTCLAITIGETCWSGVGKNCHPEEAWVQPPRSASVSLDTDSHPGPAPRPTKDLLRHVNILVRISHFDT